MAVPAERVSCWARQRSSAWVDSSRPARSAQSSKTCLTSLYSIVFQRDEQRKYICQRPESGVQRGEVARGGFWGGDRTLWTLRAVHESSANAWRLGLIRFPELITGAGSGPRKPLRPRW